MKLQTSPKEFRAWDFKNEEMLELPSECSDEMNRARKSIIKNFKKSIKV